MSLLLSPFIDHHSHIHYLNFHPLVIFILFPFQLPNHPRCCPSPLSPLQYINTLQLHHHRVSQPRALSPSLCSPVTWHDELRSLSWPSLRSFRCWRVCKWPINSIIRLELDTEERSHIYLPHLCPVPGIFLMAGLRHDIGYKICSEIFNIDSDIARWTTDHYM